MKVDSNLHTCKEKSEEHDLNWSGVVTPTNVWVWLARLTSLGCVLSLNSDKEAYHKPKKHFKWDPSAA